MGLQSGAHTRYELKYHFVWCPKYRRVVLKGNIARYLAKIIYGVAERYDLSIVELAVMPDHVHMFVRIPPKYSVSSIMGYLKGKSSLMIFDRHANLKYKYGNRHFWCRGYYVDTVGKNAKRIAEYVKNQLQEDITTDQLTLKEYIDPFTGEPENVGKKTKKPLKG